MLEGGHSVHGGDWEKARPSRGGRGGKTGLYAGMLPLLDPSGRPLQEVPSLWRIVEEQVAPSERLEVKTIMGDDAVERSLELHAEVQTLLELYREIQLGHLRQEQSHLQAADSLLAAPPHLKELMREEIRLLLRSLQQKALQEGRDQDGAIAKYNPHVVTFALKGNTGTGQPFSGSSALVRLLSSRPSNDLGALSNQLNIAHISEIAVWLRALLEDECHALERCISHLQVGIESLPLQGQLEEAHCQCAGLPAATTHEPTMAELQKVKHAMEQDLQLSQSQLGSSVSLMPKLLGRTIYQPQPSHLGGSAKGPDFRATAPASSPDPRNQVAPLCRQTLPWWSCSEKGPLGWLQQEGEELGQAQKDKDTQLHGPVTARPPQGSRLVSACRIVGAVPAFQPVPPPDPCPPPRFSPRIRLLQCKGPS